MSDLVKEIDVYLDVADCSEAYRLLERALTRLRELESGYGRLMLAALDAIPNLSGGEVKANLRDAYDEATVLIAKHRGEK